MSVFIHHLKQNMCLCLKGKIICINEKHSTQIFGGKAKNLNPSETFSPPLPAACLHHCFFFPPVLHHFYFSDYRPFSDSQVNKFCKVPCIIFISFFRPLLCRTTAAQVGLASEAAAGWVRGCVQDEKTARPALCGAAK